MVTDTNRQEQSLQADFEAGANKADWLEQKIIDLGDESWDWDERFSRICQVIEDNPKPMQDQLVSVEATIRAFFQLPEVISVLSCAIEKEAETAWKALQEAEQNASRN